MTRTLLVCLVLATPAFAQTPVYTNADLGRLHSTRPTSPIAEETWRGLEARAFRWYPPVPQRPLEPGVVVVGTAPVPFPKDPACCRLDGSRWTDPAWSVTTYLGHDRGRRSRALPPASRRR